MTLKLDPSQLSAAIRNSLPQYPEAPSFKNVTKNRDVADLYYNKTNKKHFLICNTFEDQWSENPTALTAADVFGTIRVQLAGRDNLPPDGKITLVAPIGQYPRGHFVVLQADLTVIINEDNTVTIVGQNHIIIDPMPPIPGKNHDQECKDKLIAAVNKNQVCAGFIPTNTNQITVKHRWTQLFENFSCGYRAFDVMMDILGGIDWEKRSLWKKLWQNSWLGVSSLYNASKPPTGQKSISGHLWKITKAFCNKPFVKQILFGTLIVASVIAIVLLSHGAALPFILPIVAKSLGFVGITTSVSGQFAALFTAGCFAISAACVATYHLFRGVGAWLRKAFGGGDGSAVKAAKEDNFDVESIDSSASEEVKVSHSDAVHNPTFDPAAARPIATQHKFEALGSKGQSLGFVSVAAQVAIITGADLSGAADGFESADEKDASTAATADAGIPHQLTRNEEKGENEEEDKVGSARPGSSLSGWSE